MVKFGILCAGDEELAPFLPHIQNPTVTKKAMLTFYEGRIGDTPVVALFSGVCKVNAAVAAQILIDAYQVDAILNAGTAGALDPRLDLLDTVISTEAAYHDVDEDILTDFHPWMPSIYFPADTALLLAAKRVAERRPGIHLGRMVTGERFITDSSRREILEAFSPLSVDMETASVAHVCYVNQIPFLAIRSITDAADLQGAEDFDQNCKRAAAVAKDVTLALLETLRA